MARTKHILQPKTTKMTQFKYIPKEFNTPTFEKGIKQALLELNTKPEVETKALQLEIAHQLKRIADAIEDSQGLL